MSDLCTLSLSGKHRYDPAASQGCLDCGKPPKTTCNSESGSEVCYALISIPLAQYERDYERPIISICNGRVMKFMKMEQSINQYNQHMVDFYYESA